MVAFLVRRNISLVLKSCLLRPLNKIRIKMTGLVGHGVCTYVFII